MFLTYQVDFNMLWFPAVIVTCLNRQVNYKVYIFIKYLQYFNAPLCAFFSQQIAPHIFLCCPMKVGELIFEFQNNALQDRKPQHYIYFGLWA